jgi:hypothetical protein
MFITPVVPKLLNIVIKIYVCLCASDIDFSSSDFYLQYAGSAWDELKHIRQAIGFLVLFCSFTFRRIAHDFFLPEPVSRLSITAKRNCSFKLNTSLVILSLQFCLLKTSTSQNFYFEDILPISTFEIQEYMYRVDLKYCTLIS